MPVDPIVAASPRPRILLAEDDPVSRAFLAEVLSCEAELEVHEDGAQALDSARRNRFDCLVLDRRLPGLDGSEVASALRADPASASHRAHMVALSAGLDDEGVRRLSAAGFDRALAKPVQATALLAAVRGAPDETRQPARSSGLPVLDDAMAMRALAGNAATVARLRALFAAELPQQVAAIRRYLEDPEQWLPARDGLHRLQASCGFCGAPELAEASRHLAEAMRERSSIGPALDAFVAASARTQQALAANTGVEPGTIPSA